jgi:hypothetical protein
MFFIRNFAVAFLVSTINSPCDGFSAHIFPSQTTHTSLQASSGLDTDPILPSFATKEEYTSYLQKAGSLPQGFAVGTAKGKFVSVEAPALGPLPIKATVIHLTEGPSDSWGAVFTGNRVSESWIFCLPKPKIDDGTFNLNGVIYLVSRMSSQSRQITSFRRPPNPSSCNQQ